MNASMPLLWTTSACSTVMYQSTIAWNCLVASTACANFAGTTRRVPFPFSAELAGIASPPSTAFDPAAGGGVAYPLIAVIDTPDKECDVTSEHAKEHPPVRAPLWERTGGCET